MRPHGNRHGRLLGRKPNGRADDQPGPYGPYVPWAEVTVKKVVLGSAPAGDWVFGGTLGAFTLPAAGGERLFPRTIGDTVTITETDRPGWAVAVACSPAARRASPR